MSQQVSPQMFQRMTWVLWACHHLDKMIWILLSPVVIDGFQTLRSICRSMDIGNRNYRNRWQLISSLSQHSSIYIVWIYSLPDASFPELFSYFTFWQDNHITTFGSIHNFFPVCWVCCELAIRAVLTILNRKCYHTAVCIIRNRRKQTICVC